MNYNLKDSTISRTLCNEENFFSESVNSIRSEFDDEKNFFVSYLSQRPEINTSTSKGRLNYIDLFCGGGGMSLGVSSAAKFFGFTPKLVAASDINKPVLDLLNYHFSPFILRHSSVTDLIQYDVDLTGTLNDYISPPRLVDKQLSQFTGKIDLVIGGPPCQGHSNLNNRTRRFDPRNLLYFTLPSFAIALDIPNIIIENVPSIINSSENVIEITSNLLKNYGYSVNDVVLNSSHYGVAQTRNRHFLLASKNREVDLSKALKLFNTQTISFDDITTCLPKLSFDSQFLENVGSLSSENINRIKYLHENQTFNLPNSHQPDCHKISNTYKAVYGRIRGNLPMTTITTGFSSPGRGRYIHPTEQRVINIREASRIQSIPDWYWEPAESLNFTRTNYQKIIGEAVPPLLLYPLIWALFGDNK